MQSILITGGNLEKRKKQASNYLSNYQITPLDSLIVKGKNSIGIEKIRNLENWAHQKPYQGKHQAVLILEAEKLTHPAQNALLKTLEEPPQNTLLILTVPRKDFLLPTIISRCKIIKLEAESEINLSQKQIAQLVIWIINLLESGVGERLKTSQKLDKRQEETAVFLDKLVFVLREVLLFKFSLSSLDELKKASKILNYSQILLIIRQAKKAKEVLKKNVNTKLALDNFFLDLPYLKC